MLLTKSKRVRSSCCAHQSLKADLEQFLNVIVFLLSADEIRCFATVLTTTTTLVRRADPQKQLMRARRVRFSIDTYKHVHYGENIHT